MISSHFGKQQDITL